MSGATQQGVTGTQSFQIRQINVTFLLGLGTFGATGQNTVTLSGLRVAATIRKSGAPAFDAAELSIFGVPPDVMNAVSTLGVPPTMFRYNFVRIEAGDAVNGMSLVYNGSISSAFQDFNEMPQTRLQVVSYAGVQWAIPPTTPTSFPGGADVATIMSGFAERMGLAFENNGVQVQLSSPYFAGNIIQQVQKCAAAAGIEYCVDNAAGANGVLAIWPKFGTRGGAVPLISAASGMIGYPRYYDGGMEFSTVFNPNIRVGGQIQMQSSIGTAVQYSNPSAPKPEDIVAGGPNGLWYVNGPVTHNLTAQVPGGPWTSEVACVPLGVGAVPAKGS